MTYHCNECARKRNELNPLSDQLDFTGSYYQLNKFLKHVLPNTGSYVSIFNDPDYQKYSDFIVNASISGSVEIQPNGKVNYIYFAGKDVGVLFNNGLYVMPNDAVKVVLTFDSQKIHAYPTGSLGISQAICAICSNPLIH